MQKAVLLYKVFMNLNSSQPCEIMKSFDPATKGDFFQIILDVTAPSRAPSS
jgi:hypothetical protein